MSFDIVLAPLQKVSNGSVGKRGRLPLSESNQIASTHQQVVDHLSYLLVITTETSQTEPESR